MKLSFVFVGILFIGLSAVAQPVAFKQVTNKDVRSLVKAESANETYVFLPDNESLDFLLPAAQVTCDLVFDQYLAAVDLKALQKLGDEKHIYYAFALFRVFLDGQVHNSEVCDLTQSGQLITRITGVVQALDETGKAELAKYVDRMKSQKFFSYPIRWQKPLQIVTRFSFQNLSGLGAPVDGLAEMTYHKMSSQAGNLEGGDKTSFAEAFERPDNKKALIQFFQQRMEDPSSIEKNFDAYAANKDIKGVSFRWEMTYLLPDDFAAGFLGLGDQILIRCSDDSPCYR